MVLICLIQFVRTNVLWQVRRMSVMYELNINEHKQV